MLNFLYLHLLYFLFWFYFDYYVKIIAKLLELVSNPFVLYIQSNMFNGISIQYYDNPVFYKKDILL